MGLDCRGLMRPGIMPQCTRIFCLGRAMEKPWAAARYRLFRCKQRAWLFVNLLAAWLNNEPAQTVDVMVYGMQSGSETFSVHPCNESGNARNTVCDATH